MNKVAEVKEIDDITRISSVWKPVLMSDSAKGEISSIPDVPTTAPSSGAGPTVANTDNGIPQIAGNFTCSANTTLGMMNKECEDTPPPVPGVSTNDDTSDKIEAGTEQCLTQTRGGGGTKGTDIDDTRVLVLKGCQHDKRGYCALHGMLAVKKWRQIPCYTDW